MVPGNHDVSKTLVGTVYSSAARAAWHEFDRMLTGVGAREFPYVQDIGPVRTIGLDSTATAEDGDDIVSRGEIGQPQLDALAGALDTDQACIVYTHHHYVQREPWLALADGDELLDVLASGCDIAICGHKHDRFVWSDVQGVGRIIALPKCTRPENGKLYILEVTADADSADYRWLTPDAA